LGTCRVIILAYDGLEFNLVERFRLKTIMQVEYGKTRLEGFGDPLRTPILWRSFIMGAMPNNWGSTRHIFSYAQKPWAISVPGYNEWREFQPLRAGLSKCILEKMDPKQFLDGCWEMYRRKKKLSLNLIKKGGWDLFMVHIFAPDIIGHWICYDLTQMYDLYNDLNEYTREVKESLSPEDLVLIVSDHGMYWDEKRYGGWGAHSRYGFWSSNKPLNLEKPHLTDFFEIIRSRLTK